MKDFDYYIDLPHKIELVPDIAEGGFIASFPDLPGCISVGETIEEAIASVMDAKIDWMMAALEDGVDIIEP